MSKDSIQSYERALDSSISLGEILAAAATSVVSPVTGGIAVATILLRHGARFYFDRAKERVEEVHADVLNGASDQQRERIMMGRIQAEDYFSVLNAAIADDEHAKLGCYATFLRNHLLGSVPPDRKLRLLRGLRELTHDEVQLLRRVNIAATRDMMTPGGPAQQVSQLLVATDETRGAMLDSLQRFGFLCTEEGSFKLTKLAQLAGSLYFTPDDLTAKSIGQPTWSGLRVLLATPNLSEHTQLFLRMEKILFSRAIKANIVSTAPDVLRRVPFTTRLIILLLDHHGLPEKHKAALEKLHSKVVIKVLLTDSDGKIPLDPIPQLKVARTIEMQRDGGLDEFSALADEMIAAVGARGSGQ